MTTGGAWPGLLLHVGALAVAAVLHRLRDREVFAGDARTVFTRGLAAAYLTGVVLLWSATLTVLAVLLLAGGSPPVPDARVVLPGVPLALAYTVVVLLVQQRAQEATDRLAGPVGDLGRFLRLGYGTAAPAAWRRLRAGA